MLHRNYITIEEYKNSTPKKQYEYLYKKEDKLRADNIAVETGCIAKEGINFIYCEINRGRDSTYMY